MVKVKARIKELEAQMKKVTKYSDKWKTLRAEWERNRDLLHDILN